MRHLFLVVILLGLLCSCASPEPPLYTSRFHTEKDAFMPNGWRFLEDGFYSKPASFEVKPFQDKQDERARLFSVRAGEHPVFVYYCGFFDVDDDSIINVVSNAAGKGSFSLGLDFCDSDQNSIGERHQGFNLPLNGDDSFKNYLFRLYFLASENARARFVRLVFIVDPFSELTLRDISLDITPYEVDRMDSNYIKFKEKEKKQGYRK